VHSTDEAKGSDGYGYTAKILEDEAYCDLKIEVDLPLQMPTLVLRNRSEGSMSAMTSARAYLTTNVASSREATQDSVALLRSMTRKDERHYSPKLSGVGRSGKRTSHEGALQAVSASAESASGERLIPLRRRAKCFSPLFFFRDLDGSRQASLR
jgi:hypothetical protein